MDPKQLSLIYESVKAEMLAALPPEDAEEGTKDEASEEDLTCNTATKSQRRKVEVNQRALIDKILARYASAGAVYRELLANSDDANATKAQIHFFTDDETQDFSSDTNAKSHIRQIVYRNNGMIFRPQDWERLQKIAEGNPDPEKIGAFGVGGYTMFSICEEPIVVSGNQALWFSWKGDTLWTQELQRAEDLSSSSSSTHEDHVAKARSPLPTQTDDEWTAFLLPLRETRPLTNAILLQFANFICNSLTFSGSLEDTHVFVNGKEVMHLSKVVGESKPYQVPPTDVDFTTTHGTLQLDLTTVQVRNVDLKVRFLGHISAVTADYVTASATPSLDGSMLREMERITKKKPPKSVQLQLLRSAVVQNTSTRGKASNKAAQVARNFCNTTRTGGKIYIGFKTSQTTGFPTHICAPFLPTVEREAIDLNHRYISQFNLDLLECSAEAAEMDLLADELLNDDAFMDTERSKETANDDAAAESRHGGESGSFLLDLIGSVTGIVSPSQGQCNRKKLVLQKSASESISESERQAILLMKSVCANESTPESQVGETIQIGFRKVLPQKYLPVMTCQGITNSTQAKLPARGFESICKLAVVRKTIAEKANEYLNTLAGCKYLDVVDVVEALKEQVYTEDDLITILKLLPSTTYEVTQATEVAQAIQEHVRIKVLRGPDKKEIVMRLNEFKYFLDKILIALGSKYPLKLVLGIRPYTEFEWVRYLCHHPVMRDKSQRLYMWQRAIYALAKSDQSNELGAPTYSALLSKSKCIPNDLVMKNEEVILNAGVAVPNRVAMDKHVGHTLYPGQDFKVVSQALRNKIGRSAFLTRVGSEISTNDAIERCKNVLNVSDSVKILRNFQTSVANQSANMKDISASHFLFARNHNTECKYRASELCFPTANARPFLKFPSVNIIAWPKSEGSLAHPETSVDGRFLLRLGVRMSPPIKSLIKDIRTLGVDNTTTKLETGLRSIARLIAGNLNCRDEFQECTFESRKILLPCKVWNIQNKAQRTVESPESCFLSSECAVLGFPVVFDEKVGTLFSCKQLPDSQQTLRRFLDLVDELKQTAQKPMTSEESHGIGDRLFAEQVISRFNDIFKYMENVDPVVVDISHLHAIPVIPYLSARGMLAWSCPDKTLFQGARDEAISKLFLQIQYRGARFLTRIGVRDRISPTVLCDLLLQRSPKLVLTVLGRYSLYLDMLKRITEADLDDSFQQHMRKEESLVAYTIDPSTKKA
ncbi:MAG: hypothetical protein SGBAC_006122, partial [Bacillariaceae sp.]